jgi:gamma-glutamylcyclotransferase (GGCT)/AIG2-like uncharacterized protein YtfP
MPMHKIFLYHNPWLQNEEGKFASVAGFRLETPDAAIRQKGSKVYGRVFDVEDWFINDMDLFNSIIIGYSRIQVIATLGGGEEVLVHMYEYHPEHSNV